MMEQRFDRQQSIQDALPHLKKTAYPLTELEVELGAMPSVKLEYVQSSMSKKPAINCNEVVKRRSMDFLQIRQS